LLTNCVAAHDVGVLQLAKEDRRLARGLVVGAAEGRADARDLAQSKSQLAGIALLLGSGGRDSKLNLRGRDDTIAGVRSAYQIYTSIGWIQKLSMSAIRYARKHPHTSAGGGSMIVLQGIVKAPTWCSKRPPGAATTSCSKPLYTLAWG
jgi:hypothetical protein